MLNFLGKYKTFGIHFSIWVILFIIINLQFYLVEDRIISHFLLKRFGITMATFYINYLFLVPKLLLKRKILLYIISIFFTIFIPVFLFENVQLLDEGKLITFDENAPEIIQDTLPSFGKPKFANSVTLDSIFANEQIDFIEAENMVFVNYPFIYFDYLGPALFIMIFLIVGTSIRIYEEWNKNEKNRKKIETQKVRTELQILRSQLNPRANALKKVFT